MMACGIVESLGDGGGGVEMNSLCETWTSGLLWDLGLEGFPAPLAMALTSPVVCRGRGGRDDPSGTANVWDGFQSLG